MGLIVAIPIGVLFDYLDYFTVRLLIPLAAISVCIRCYLTSLIMVFSPLIFSPATNASNCFTLARLTAAKD